MGIRNWYRNYQASRRKKLVGSLTPEEIRGTRVYIEAQGIIDELGAANSALTSSIREHDNRASGLEGSLKEANLLVGTLQDRYSEAIRELEIERVRNKTVAQETAGRKDAEYSAKIQELEDERTRLEKQAERATRGLEELEGKYQNIVKDNRRLAEAKKRAVIENALTRLSKGEKPEDFNCNDITGELARRYAAIQVQLEDLFDERNRLKKMVEGVSNSYYETLFDILEAKGDFRDRFCLLYVDHNRNVSRVSKGVENYLGVKPEEIIGKPLRDLTKRTISRDLRRALTSDWRENEEKYRQVTLNDGRKVDILVQRANDHDGSPVGAFVYFSNHNILQFHRSHKRVLEYIRDVGAKLGEVANMAYKSPGLA